MIGRLQNLLRSKLKVRPTSSLDSPPTTDTPATLDDLIAAVIDGDVEGARRAILHGAPVNGRRADGVTALTVASSKELVDMVRTLLELGADPAVANNENLIAFDYARHQGNLTIENMLTAAERGERSPASLANASKCGCGTCRDLAAFLDHAKLDLPEAGWAHYKDKIRNAAGLEAAAKIEAQLEKTGYRALFEQLFGSEALACALPMAGNFTTIRSPMTLGSYETDYARRRGQDIVDNLKGNFDAADKFLRSLLPDEVFDAPPKRLCEIGGAWGGTIKHFVDRFEIEEYQNYEPDRHYADWATERFGVKNMPVDGETLRGTETNSMDLVIANNVFIIVPPLKIWSYLMEMRRVVRKSGLIVFNAIVSDQVSEQSCRDYLTGYFPRRTFQVVPRDFIDRTFVLPNFNLLKIEGAFFIYKRVN